MSKFSTGKKSDGIEMFKFEIVSSFPTNFDISLKIGEEGVLNEMNTKKEPTSVVKVYRLPWNFATELVSNFSSSLLRRKKIKKKKSYKDIKNSV